MSFKFVFKEPKGARLFDISGKAIPEERGTDTETEDQEQSPEALHISQENFDVTDTLCYWKHMLYF